MLKEFENHPEFSEVLQTAKQEYAQSGTFFLEDSYILQLQEAYQLFPRILEEVRCAAAAVRADAEAACYALFVCRAMANREVFLKNLPLFTFPEEQYPFYPLLCLLHCIPDIHRFLKGRDLPEDVIQYTLNQFECCVFLYHLRYDRLGLHKRYFDWLQHYVDHEIININRLRFEILTLEDPIYLLRHRKSGEQVLLMGGPRMNRQGLYADTPPVEEAAFTAAFRETDHSYCGNIVSCAGRCTSETGEFSKEDYELILQPGDTCLSVHIPNEGDFSPETCEACYRRAAELFRTHFPELTIKAFHCHSWLMAPELEGILKPGSRITAFSRKYLRYPIPTQGEDVFYFVFLSKFKTYADMLEDTSLRRALKQLYLKGEYLYEYGGIFTF